MRSALFGAVLGAAFALGICALFGAFESDTSAQHALPGIHGVLTR